MFESLTALDGWTCVSLGSKVPRCRVKGCPQRGRACPFRVCPLAFIGGDLLGVVWLDEDVVQKFV